jgi:uncharacterized integral membrane protein
VLQVVLVTALVFAVGIAVFAVQNTAPVAVSFLVWRADGMAASVLVLIAAALGAGLTLLLGAAREVRLRLRLRAQGQELAAAQDRLRGLDAVVAHRPEGVGSAAAPPAPAVS